MSCLSDAKTQRPQCPKKGRIDAKFGHFGLINIRETVAKYGGDVQIAEGPETYSIQAILYCRTVNGLC